MITARARVTLPKADLEMNETTGSRLGDFEIAANFGDYGRNDKPTLMATLDGASFVAEFATPDDARKLAEQLLAIARTAEEKLGMRGPEYRLKLARESFMTDLKEAMTRAESTLGVSTNDIEPMNIFTKKLLGIGSSDALDSK